MSGIPLRSQRYNNFYDTTKILFKIMNKTNLFLHFFIISQLSRSCFLIVSPHPCRYFVGLFSFMDFSTLLAALSNVSLWSSK